MLLCVFAYYIRDAVQPLLASETFAYVRFDRILKSNKPVKSSYDVSNHVIHRYSFYADTNSEKEFDESNFMHLDTQKDDALLFDINCWRDWPFLKEPSEGGYFNFSISVAKTTTTREDRKKKKSRSSSIVTRRP
jgi:hypothetical protein